MRKRFTLILFLLLLLPLICLGEGILFSSIPEVVRPGKQDRILLTSEISGTATVGVYQGDVLLCTIKQNLTIVPGATRLVWDGFDEQGDPITPGTYSLVIDVDGVSYTAPLVVGGISPITEILQLSEVVAREENWTATVSCNMSGTLVTEFEVGGIWEVMDTRPVQAEGDVIIDIPLLFSGLPLPMDTYPVRITLKDAQGVRGTSSTASVIVYSGDEPPQATPLAQAISTPTSSAPTATPAPIPTVLPSRERTQADETSYWTMPLGDLSDEQAIWEIMIQPITVIDLSGRTARETYKLRATPDKSTARDNVVGEVTYKSQGVHVLETLDNGWSRVEVYNTSYGPNNTNRRGYGNTGELITGYVETAALTQVTPKLDYGLLIDKLNQTMYIFSEGEIIGTLLVSTGKPTAAQPWNETPAGEFLMISRSGGFPSGNLWCAMGMLINGGCLIHEVPCIINEETGYQNYAYTEPYLGQKASHGCIRVQRVKNEQGQNMTWLWNNIKVNTKVLIWEDSTRYIAYPDAALQLYYNPIGGKYYHAASACSSINKRYLPLTGLTYAELENEPYAALLPCKTCTPPERPETIREKNILNGYEQ